MEPRAEFADLREPSHMVSLGGVQSNYSVLHTREEWRIAKYFPQNRYEPVWQRNTRDQTFMTFSLSRYMAPIILYILLAFNVSIPLAAETITAPKLYDDSDYNEFWEQQFLFENGTIVTSQFLIANFPFSKQHGLMIATFKKPNKDMIIIKNGRTRDGWDYDPAKQRLSIFQHELSGEHPHYKTSLNNTAAEVDVTYISNQQPIPLILPNNALGLPEISLYAPTAKAHGRWRAGPEIGGAGQGGAWEDLGKGLGFGLHVVQRKSLNNAIRYWQRFTSITSTKGYTPILHSFETPNGERQTVLILFSATSDPIRFDNVEISESNEGTKWQIHAKAGSTSLTGSLTSTYTIGEFLLTDHLNSIEAMVAGSLADVARKRFSTSYSMTLKINGEKTHFEGTALAEEITLGKEKKRKRKPRR